MAEFSFNAVWSVWEKVPVLLLYVACKPLFCIPLLSLLSLTLEIIQAT